MVSVNDKNEIQNENLQLKQHRMFENSCKIWKKKKLGAVALLTPKTPYDIIPIIGK